MSGEKSTKVCSSGGMFVTVPVAGHQSRQETAIGNSRIDTSKGFFFQQSIKWQRAKQTIIPGLEIMVISEEPLVNLKDEEDKAVFLEKELESGLV